MAAIELPCSAYDTVSNLPHSASSQSHRRSSTWRATRHRRALVQMSCAAAKSQNVDKAVARIGEAAAAGAQIVCLQELFAGLYPCQSEDHAASARPSRFPAPPASALPAAAREHGVVVVGSFFERRAAGLYHNTAVIFDADGSMAGMYRKMHIPDDPLYYEKFYFTPGDLGFRSFRHALRPRGRVRLLGPVVSRGGAADGAGRRADHLLSHGDRLAPERKGRCTAPASTRPGRR